MTETLARGYSSESTQRELSNEYQHDRFRLLRERERERGGRERERERASNADLKTVSL